MWVVTPFFFQGLHLTIYLLRLRLSTPLQCNEMRLAGNLLSFCALYDENGVTHTPISVAPPAEPQISQENARPHEPCPNQPINQRPQRISRPPKYLEDYVLK